MIDMIRMKYTHQEGVKLGFRYFNFSDDEKMKFETSSQSGGKFISDVGTSDAKNSSKKFIIASVRNKKYPSKIRVKKEIGNIAPLVEYSSDQYSDTFRRLQTLQ